jgi:group I intron endonuclease
LNNYKIYCLTNLITNEKYIGVTKQKMIRRFKAGKGYKPTTKINLAIQKYGWENFDYEILFETENKELAGMLEQEYIKKYNTISNGYNFQSGGFKDFSNPMSEKTRSKLKSIHKGKHYSKKTEFKKGTRTEYTLSIMKPVYCVELDRVFDSINIAEKELNISHHIWDCLKGKRNKCGGYHWKLVKEDE